MSITDATTDHANDTAVTVTTKPGVIPNVSITGSADGTANTAAVAGSSATSVANTISWTPASTLTASTSGTANYQDLTIDFTNVVFGAAGVYRYVISEALTDGGYAASGVTETTSTTNPHTRYLDVYVRPAPTGFTDGTAAADWDIYGYVCVLENEDITDAGDSATTGAVKTNGFVAGSNDGTSYLADSYYTFNVTVSKTVTNDAYAKAMTAFPFTVTFTNANVTKAVDISSDLTGTPTGFTNPDPAALSAGTTTGVANIKDGQAVKYIGIPNGTSVAVYETNPVTGVTYQVTTSIDGATSGTGYNIDQAVLTNETSTAMTLSTTSNADDDVDHTIAIDNNLQLISPTGVVLRVAPYALMLVAGVTLFIILAARRRKAKENND